MSSPNSPRSANLRGTSHRGGRSGGGQQEPTLREVRYFLDREPEPRLNSITELPEKFAYFPIWREKVLSSLLATGCRANDIERYIEVMLKGEQHELDTRDDVESIRQLDMKLHDCVLKVLKGKHEHLATQVIDEVPRGRGRQAMRKLAEIYRFNIDEYRNEAARALQLDNVDSMQGL